MRTHYVFFINTYYCVVEKFQVARGHQFQFIAKRDWNRPKYSHESRTEICLRNASLSDFVIV